MRRKTEDQQGSRAAPRGVLLDSSACDAAVCAQASAVGDAGSPVQLDAPAVRPRGRRAAAAAVPAGYCAPRRGGRCEDRMWVDGNRSCQAC